MADSIDNSVAGENDSWMVFERQTEEGFPLVVFARSGHPVIADGLVGGHVSVLLCRTLDGATINSSGMPQDVDVLSDFGDRINAAIAASSIDALHVANATGDGGREIFFAHAAPVDLEPILAAHPVAGYSVTLLPDVSLEMVADLIVPNELDHRMNGAMQIISNLESHGDDGTAVRPTQFWFYGEKPALNQTAADLAVHGFTIDHWTDEGDGIILNLDTAVDFGTFQGVTARILNVVERHGVDYDGWETAVVRDTAPAPVEPEKPRSFFKKLFGG